jgi:transposase-like protein
VRLSASDRARFAAQVQPSGGCWLWTGHPDRDGYGTFKIDGKTLRAHRVSYQIVHGAAPTQPVLHRCGNRLCVKPQHLKQGTLVENVKDMRHHGTIATGDRNGARKHPERVARGEASGAAKLTAEQVELIRMAHRVGAPVARLARDYGVNKSTISRVVSGKQWKGAPVTRASVPEAPEPEASVPDPESAEQDDAADRSTDAD